MAAPAATATRDRLLDEAERLFARNGVQGVTTREIVEAAEQRNTSAVSYHFGSRAGLLLEVLARHGAPVDVERGVLRRRVGDDPALSELVSCLVVPYAALLDSTSSRSYVRIVAQLRGRFAAWRTESDVDTTRNLTGILDEIEARPMGSPAVRRERIIALLMLLTGSTAERARRIDEGLDNELSHDEFVDNLIAVCTAVVSA